uniref:Uncharacterized protein n=1 Tax=Pyxicephalus adspersus TaxID=30357 RepID=A0AAV3A445_PYXAD|nr:TPA: hypothetical protein GDO54_002367 [Pyxicephalus adspersus]
MSHQPTRSAPNFTKCPAKNKKCITTINLSALSPVLLQIPCSQLIRQSPRWQSTKKVWTGRSPTSFVVHVVLAELLFDSMPCIFSPLVFALAPSVSHDPIQLGQRSWQACPVS